MRMASGLSDASSTLRDPKNSYRTSTMRMASSLSDASSTLRGPANPTVSAVRMASTSVQCPSACTVWTKHTHTAHKQANKQASCQPPIHPCGPHKHVSNHRGVNVHGLNRKPRSSTLSRPPQVQTLVLAAESMQDTRVDCICTHPSVRSPAPAVQSPSRTSDRDPCQGTCVGALPGRALVIDCSRPLLDRRQAPSAQRDNSNVCLQLRVVASAS